MRKPLLEQDVKGSLLVLGTGTSVGVPVIGCGCDVCTSKNPRNNRTRCSVLFGLPHGNLLIDTPPDLRAQLVRERIGRVDAVAFTHEHADHLHGLDDLRLFPFTLGHPVPLYCEPVVERRIRSVFDYAFSNAVPTHPGGAPQLSLQSIDECPLEILGTTITPIRLMHGPRFQVLGFRVGNVAYCTDVKSIPDESMVKLQNLDTLILGALRYSDHPTHMSVDEALAMVELLRPKMTFLTHTSHELEYEAMNSRLPDHVKLAYDGQKIQLS